MKIEIVLKKGLLGALTFLVAFITPDIILKFVPDSIENMTVGAVIAAVIVAVTNIVKHWSKK